MQYSSALISPKLWAELATYVRQLCKISERGPCWKSDWKRAEGQGQENTEEEGGAIEMNNRRNLITRMSCFKLSYLRWTGRRLHIHRRWLVGSNYANILLSHSSTPEIPEDSSRSARESKAEKKDSLCRKTRISTSCPVSKWETHTMQTSILHRAPPYSTTSLSSCEQQRLTHWKTNIHWFTHSCTRTHPSLQVKARWGSAQK